MRFGVILAGAILLSSCGREVDVAEKSQKAASSIATPDATRTSAPPPEDDQTIGWNLKASGAGLELSLGTTSQAIMRIFCTPGEKVLTLNVGGFQPIGSEERLSVGTGSYVATLVADARGDPNLGGVSGVGAVPESLETLFTGSVSASYGSQQSGPHPAPPKNLSRKFVAACEQGIAAIETVVFS